MGDRDSSRTPVDDPRTTGFVAVHTHIGNLEGVIVELRRNKYEFPSERDMHHLSDEKARELYDELGAYLEEQGDE